MFGHIDKIEVGQVFKDRAHVADLGIHAPLMAGIWGAQEGAYSIVLSGGYEDDIDELDYILYTGQGGQDTPGGKQIADQVFTKGNLGLKLSCIYNLPVRVIRGHQVSYGPELGYRYDGLYRVQKYERVRGKSGFYICRFHMISEQSFANLEKILSSSFKPDYQPADRTESKIKRLKRNPKLGEKVKRIYNFHCQICNIFLDSPSGPIAIGAHIKPLGYPHNGPDIIENILCLCPNHHDQFDALTFSITPNTRCIVGLDGYENKSIKVKGRHNINDDFLEDHWKRWFEKGKELP